MRRIYIRDKLLRLFKIKVFCKNAFQHITLLLFNRAKTARLWLEFRNITVTVFGRQVIHIDQTVWIQDDHTLNQVGKFTHITRPVMLHHRIDRTRRETDGLRPFRFHTSHQLL
ncbi:Uncharacterised protein [Vibrio cholerae]|nr:Uncharacterised protein [Vibrio cholerae]